MIGLYHLALFFFRPKALSALPFGLVRLITATKAGLMGEQILGLAIPALSGAGGEEFCLILPGIPASAARILMKKSASRWKRLPC